MIYIICIGFILLFSRIRTRLFICCSRNMSLFPLILTGLIITGPGVTEPAAQPVTIQGIISDDYSGQPLDGANIVLQEIEGDQIRGTATDRNGFYQMGGIEPGRYVVRISYVGYIAYEDTLALGALPRMTLNVALEHDDELLDEVVIAPDGGAALRDAGRQRISQADMRRVPTPAAGGDLASYLQAMPGVVATGDRGGDLFVRGGTPSQNMVLMDGAMIYRPFHIVGFFSAFPENLVSSVDLYTGGFGPRYTGRTSSVMDVEMRDGDRHRTHASAAVSPFLGEALVEGPLIEGSSSWIASVRRSLIEETSGSFMREEQPLRFESQFLKVSQMSETQSRCSAMAMRTFDEGQLDFEGDDSFSWTNFVLSGRCLSLPEDSNMFMEMNSGVSYMSNTMNSPGEMELYSNITRFHLDASLRHYAGDIRLEYGMFTHMKWMNYDMSELFHTSQDDYNSMFDLGVHAEATIPVGNRVRMRPGAAFSVHPGQYRPSLEPRMWIFWQPFGRETEELSVTAGLYRQALAGISDMRDAGSAFLAWMPAPVGDSQMEAIHTLAGWQQSLGSGFHLSAEGYYKWMKNQPVTVWSTLAQFTTDLALADGTILGSDVRLEYTGRAFYGFIGYGFSRTEYVSGQDHFGTWFDEPVQRYHPPHDRRHQINTMFSLDIGQYTAGLRWQFGTGLPFTRPMGFDAMHRFEGEMPNVRRNYGTPRVILERPYGGRLPGYHRLDVSLERTIEFPIVRLNIQAGAINIYDQVNMFYYDVYTQHRIDQMPVAPYISIKLETL